MSKPKGEVVSDARNTLVKFVELYQKPAVRNDPVIRTMLKGLLPTASSFETASMAVATLRNAGCLDSDKDSPTGEQKVPDGQPKPAQKKKENTPVEKPKQTLRGFHRVIDTLLEDAVFRGEYPDKESHPAAKKLRQLRKDPNRVLLVMRFKAKYEDKTYSNGKKGKVFTGLEKSEDGKPITDEAETAAVKDLSDFDLLAIESYETLVLIINEVQKLLFSWADKDSYTVPENPATVWPSLKGTQTLAMISGGDADCTSLLKAFAAENFSRVGPSPTLNFPNFGKHEEWKTSKKA